MNKGISAQAFANIKNKFGSHASWTLWQTPQSGKWLSKADIGDMSIFDNLQILKELNPNIVFLSICRSREYEITENPPVWINFHDGRSMG